MTRGFYEQLGAAPDADLDTIKAAYGRAVAHLLKRREATVARGGDPSSLDLARSSLDDAWEVLADPARRRRYDAMLAVAGDGLVDADLDDLWSRVAGAMIPPALAAAARIVDAATELGLGPLPEPPRPHGSRVHDERALGEEERATATTRTRFGAPRRVRTPAAGFPAGGFDPDTSAPTELDPERPTQAGGPGAVLQMQAPSARVQAPAIELPAPDTFPTEAGPATEPITRPRAAFALADAGTNGAESAPTVQTGPPPGATSPGDLSSHEVDHLVDSLGYSGALLRTLREERGLSLDDVAHTTRISSKYLDAVEREDFEALPTAPTFVRGYVREMARLLGLDVDRVVAGYMRRFRADG